MSHGEKSASPLKEGMLGILTGSLFGLTNAVVGQPFDTVKTMLQAQDQYMKKMG